MEFLSKTEFLSGCKVSIPSGDPVIDFVRLDNPISYINHFVLLKERWRINQMFGEVSSYYWFYRSF